MKRNSRFKLLPPAIYTFTVLTQRREGTTQTNAGANGGSHPASSGACIPGKNDTNFASAIGRKPEPDADRQRRARFFSASPPVAEDSAQAGGNPVDKVKKRRFEDVRPTHPPFIHRNKTDAVGVKDRF